MWFRFRVRSCWLQVGLGFVLAAAGLRAQTGATGTGASGSTRATPLPASGREGPAGSVVTGQSSAGGSGVATLSSSVQVTGSFAGGVPEDGVPPGPVHLTLSEAVRRGLAANLGTVSANNSVRASRARRIQSLSALLPSISANASETVTQVNLAAYGFQFKLPPGLNFSIPSVVGPFSYSQLQGSLSQSVYDPVARRNWQASKETERAAVLSERDTRELVVIAVAGTYLQTLALEARLSSQRAQVENANAIYQQAVVRKAAGTNSKIDVTRSLVELQTQQQRLSSIDADLRKQKIALARILGLPLDREVILSESFGPSRAVPVPDAASCIRAALAERRDLQAAEAQVRAADWALSAARAERLPSVSLNGDYGVLGPNPASVHGVFAITGSLNIPIWQGGRVKGDTQEAEATLRQRQAEFADERAQVEQDVRDALIELETAAGQVRLAESNRSYANETLSEARDRFVAGVATTVEVVQAQEQVAGAESDSIASLFSFHLARLSLSRAMGGAEVNLSNLLSRSQP